MPDVNFDALADSITVVKNGKTYTMVPPLTANQAQWFFDHTSPEEGEERYQRALQAVSDALAPHHKAIPAAKVGDIFALGEVYHLLRLFLGHLGRVEEPPALKTPPARTKTRTPRRTPAR